MAFINFPALIFFENDNYIVINKPSNISTLEDRGDGTNILFLAKNYWPDAQVCHRLDKETSGVLLIAKTPEAYRNAAMQFEAREVQKIYHAIEIIIIIHYIRMYVYVYTHIYIARCLRHSALCV